jgi:hypothetical protein
MDGAQNASPQATQQTAAEDSWTVAGRTFHSRLIVGTGKYKDYATNAAAAEAAGAEIVTVAVRRVNLSDPSQPMLTDFVRPDRFTYLPNTAGCFTGEDAVRTARGGRLVAGQARGAVGPQDPLPRHGGDAEGAAPARGRRVRGDGLLHRRPGLLPQARGRRRRRHHAAGRPHRLRARRAEPGHHPPDRGAVEGPRHRRRRRRHGF